MIRSLERYSGVVQDPDAFLEACRQPLPETVWTPFHHAASLDAYPSGGLRPMAWTRQGFRVDRRDRAFGVHFLLGGLLIQEEAAMMAVKALGPRPGELVLDLCAAPGNKTVQLAKAVGPSGWVVANDVSAARLQILRGMADRFHLPNLSLVVHDGTSFPLRNDECTGAPFLFDAVLADVPCSCEGTCRKNMSVFDRMNDQRTASLPELQESLLRRAIQLTKPGGRILYATCTFAPEENELVLQRVLDAPDAGNEVALEPVQIPGALLDTGLTSWNGTTLSSEMQHAVRIWPHRNDTGGFFFALLRKETSGDLLHSGAESHAEQRAEPRAASHAASRADSVSRSVSDSSIAAQRGLDGSQMPWCAYDLPTQFLSMHSSEASGRKHERIVASHRPSAFFNEQSVGFSGVNIKSREPRPSSALACYMAPHARAGVADIGTADLARFLSRETVEPVCLVPPADRTRYVLVRSGGVAVGLGHINSSGHLESLFPRNFAGLPVTEWLNRLSGE